MKEELSPLPVNKLQMMMMPSKPANHGKELMRKHADPAFDEAHNPEEMLKKREELSSTEPTRD